MRKVLLCLCCVGLLIQGCTRPAPGSPLNSNWQPEGPKLEGTWQSRTNAWTHAIPLESGFAHLESDKQGALTWRYIASSGEVGERIPNEGRVLLEGGYGTDAFALESAAISGQYSLLRIDPATGVERERLPLPLAPYSGTSLPSWHLRFAVSAWLDNEHTGNAVWIDGPQPEGGRRFQWLEIDMANMRVTRQVEGQTPSQLDELRWDPISGELFAFQGVWDQEALTFAQFNRVTGKFERSVSRKHQALLPKSPPPKIPEQFLADWEPLGWWPGRFDFGDPDELALALPVGDRHNPQISDPLSFIPKQPAAHGKERDTWIGDAHLVVRSAKDSLVAMPLESDLAESLRTRMLLLDAFPQSTHVHCYQISANELLILQVLAIRFPKSGSPDAFVRFGRVESTSTSVEWLGWIDAPGPVPGAAKSRDRLWGLNNPRLFQSRTHWLLTLGTDNLIVIPLPPQTTRIPPRELR